MEQLPSGLTAPTTPFSVSKQSWKPKPYQERAIRLLLSQAAGGLFLDPGLGKTSIVLAAFSILKKRGFAGKMLIIAPLRPMYKVWPDEIQKWEEFSDLTYSILHGKEKERALAADVDIHIINPEGLPWLVRKLPQYTVLCIDESSKFKDSSTKRFKLLKPLLQNFARRWILTGTPAPNGLEDLFGQLYILDLGRSLGRYITHFRNTYFTQNAFNAFQWVPRPSAWEEVVNLISPLVLQLSAEDHLQMPKLQSLVVSVYLPPDAQKIYKEVETEFLSLLEAGMIVAGNAAAAGTKCRQIANGAVYLPQQQGAKREYAEIHDEKLDALEGILAELNGAPAIIFYEYQHDLERIRARLGDVPVLGSGLTGVALTSLVDRFNAGVIPVLLGHPASMGHGLNLQAVCRHVIWFGITWDLELYDQAIARVYRQGQKAESVLVYHIVAKRTKDEDVMLALEKKDRTQQDFLKAVGTHRDLHFGD